MQSIGSLTEKNFKKQLVLSHIDLFNNQKYTRLLNIIKTNFPEMKTAYFIGHIPEQGEDLFRILINTNLIVEIEIDRYETDKKSIIKLIPVNDYKKELKKVDQIYLMVALNLAENDLKTTSIQLRQDG